jgi:SnoaL-like domain
MKKIFLLLMFLVPLVSFQEIKHDNLTVVSGYFDFLFKKGDFGSLQKIIAKDAKYTQAEGLPYGGIYTGFSEWIQMFTKVQTYFDLQLTEDPVLFSNPANNKVVANFTVQFKSKKTKKEITMSITELFELNDGMITSIKPYYFDTKTLVDFIKEN